MWSKDFWSPLYATWFSGTSTIPVIPTSHRRDRIAVSTTGMEGDQRKGICASCYQAPYLDDRYFIISKQKLIVKYVIKKTSILAKKSSLVITKVKGGIKQKLTIFKDLTSIRLSIFSFVAALLLSRFIFTARIFYQSREKWNK